MVALHPTRTRLQLLRHVADRHVWLDFVADDSWLEAPGQTPVQLKVTSRVQELESAGWITIPGGDSRWELTADGTAVLHGGGASC